MRAVQIVEESGPESALSLVEVPEPEASHMLTPGSGVVVDVHVAGLRQKVDNPKSPEFIVTVHGLGYKFVG